VNIVLDANILISAFFWGGNPRLVLERVITGIDTLYISKEILNEIEDVMERPTFHTTKEAIMYFITSLEELAHNIIPEIQKTYE
jgi:predicted nucleic acid-binding protein